MAFFVDASIAGAWLLPDEENTLAEQETARMADENAVAPDLLRHEIRSIMLNGERRGRISDDLAHSALARFRVLPLQLLAPGDDTEVVRLSRKYRLSASTPTISPLRGLSNSLSQRSTVDWRRQRARRESPSSDHLGMSIDLPAPISARMAALDTIAAVLPIDRSDKLAQILTD
jgi:predicted nucleic acid-binding protein